MALARSSKRIAVGVILAFSLCMTGDNRVHAAIVTFDFIAEVTAGGGTVLGLGGGDLFSGAYSFDSTAPNVNAPNPDFSAIGRYRFFDPPNQIVVNIGAGFVINGQFEITVRNDGLFKRPDKYEIVTPNNLPETFEYELVGPASALNTTALLLEPPDLNAFLFNRGVFTRVIINQNQRATLRFTMVALTLRQALEISEPATLALFAFGLAGVGFMRRRKAF